MQLGHVNEAHLGQGLGRFFLGVEVFHLEVYQPQAHAVEFILDLGLDGCAHFINHGREIESRFSLQTQFPHHILESRYDVRPQGVVDLVCGVETLTSGEFADKELRVGNPHPEDAVADDEGSPHTDAWMADGDGVARSPTHFGELGHVDKVHLGLERRLAAKSLADQIHQQGDVGRGDGVATGIKGIQGLAVADKDGSLPRPHDELRADAEIPHALLGHPLHDLFGSHRGNLNYIKNTCHWSSSLKRIL